MSVWENRRFARFRHELRAAAEAFPCIEDPADHEGEKHITLFVHGYNTDWVEAARRYQEICASLFSGANSMGSYLVQKALHQVWTRRNRPLLVSLVNQLADGRCRRGQ